MGSKGWAEASAVKSPCRDEGMGGGGVEVWSKGWVEALAVKSML